MTKHGVFFIILILIGISSCDWLDGSQRELRNELSLIPNRIAFVSDRDHNQEIYTIRADGTDLKNLTIHEANDYNPRWSPNGSQIAFVSDRDHNEEIYLMNVNESLLTNISKNSAQDRSPVWSPDGQQLAYLSDRSGVWAIYIAQLDRPESRHLVDTFTPHTSLEWSPSGDKLAFVSAQSGFDEIYLINIDGSSQKQLSHKPEHIELASNWQPLILDWSPDGTHLLIMLGTPVRNFYILDLSDLQLTQLTTENELAGLGQWSSSGNQLALSFRPTLNNDILVVLPNGDMRNLTNDPNTWDHSPRWSPDDQWILFLSDRDDRTYDKLTDDDLYLVKVNGSEIINLTNHPANDYDPQWQP